jgi:tRNA-modifying protein YgfZ
MMGYEAIVDDVAAVRLREIGLVEVGGPDACTFLQSLASQDLDGMAIGEARHSLLLEPQGKLVADFIAARVGDETYWLRCEQAVAPQLAAGLARFKIRVKVDIIDRSVDHEAIALRGPNSTAAAVTLREGVERIDASRPGFSGVDLIGASSALDSIDLGTITEADVDALEVARIEARQPRQPADIDERTIAQEAFLDESAVSFTKGCFLGQELVCRIDSRGRVNRTLRRIRFAQSVPVGADVRFGDKTVGTVTSAAVSPRLGPIALATVRRECPSGADITAADIAGTVD